MDAGKSLRWRRFSDARTGHALMVPIDHGLTLGPIDGIESVAAVGGWIGHPAITGVIVHKGMAQRLAERRLLASCGVMVHLNGMSTLAPDPDRKELLTDVETAVRAGADAVSLQVNFDGRADAHNLRMLGAVVDAASAFGLPVLTMLYDKVGGSDADQTRRRLRQWMRSAVELGTDALKLGTPADGAFEPLLDGLGEDVEVFFAGGDVASDDAIVAMARETRAAGAAGLCIGRNVFGRPDPGGILGRLRDALVTGAAEHTTRTRGPAGTPVAAGLVGAGATGAGRA